MKTDTDSDSDQDSEHVGNRRRGRMKLGPRRLAAFTAKRLQEGNHCGKEQQVSRSGADAGYRAGRPGRGRV